MVAGPSQPYQGSMSKYINKYINLSERASHALLGQGDHTLLERGLSHAVGYAFSPLLGGLELLLPNQASTTVSSGGRRETSANHNPTSELMPPKKKGKPKQGKQQRPKQQQKKKQWKKTPQQQQRKPGKQKNKSAKVGPQNHSRPVKPPVAYGTVGTTGFGFTFSAGSRPGCMTMTGWNYCGTVEVARGTGSTNVWVRINNAAEFLTQWFLMPQNDAYFFGALLTMAKLFTRFRIKVQIHYRPTCATTQPGLLLYCYYPDSMGIYLQTGKRGNQNTFADAPTKVDIGGAPWQCEGSVYVPFVSPWTYFQKDQDYAYIAAPTYTIPIDPTVTTMYDMRSTNCGVIGITGTGFTPPGTDNTSYAVGEMWVKYEVEFCDMLTQQATTTPSLARDHDLNVMLARLRAIEASEEKEQDDRKASVVRAKSPLGTSFKS